MIISYLLLFYAALSGRGGDIFILLTTLTFGYLLYQDRGLVVERIQRYRSFVNQHLGS